jgi:hypothetical protein
MIRTPKKLAQLKPDEENAREHPEANLALIGESLDEVGAARSLVIDEAGRILAGNGVASQAAAKGFKLKVVDTDAKTIIAVRRTGLTEQQKRRLALFDNRTGELSRWSPAVLAAFKEASPENLAGLFTEPELKALLAAVDTPAAVEPRLSLVERFGVPPFSVLDARQGYWQDRKRAWLALGIESELGRGAGTWVESQASGSPMDRQQAMKARARVAPGGSPRPAMKLQGGKTTRGDGRGRKLR